MVDNFQTVRWSSVGVGAQHCMVDKCMVDDYPTVRCSGVGIAGCSNVVVPSRVPFSLPFHLGLVADMVADILADVNAPKPVKQ